MKQIHAAIAVLLSFLLLTVSLSVLSQVSPRDVNGWRNSATDGLAMDTNVTFTLQMTLAGEDNLRDSAFLGQDISISTIIRPEEEDIGQAADIIIVDYIPGAFLRMRNSDGNFVVWNGSLRTLVPSAEGITLEAETQVEVFSGQLGATGNHRIFVGFLVDDVLFFTPSALRFDIEEPLPDEPTALEQAQALFESTISPRIVQGRCIECHVSGGLASGQALHIFVRTSNTNHLAINFGEFEEVHAARGTNWILSKVQGQLGHVGGVQLTAGSTDFNSLSDFLGLLDQSQAQGTASGFTDSGGSSLADPDVQTEDPYGDYYGPQ